MNTKWIPVFLAILIIVGCQPPTKDHRYDSTIEMANYLRLKADSARRTMAFPYFNDYLVKRLKHSLTGLPYDRHIGQRLDFGLALLMKGENDWCISEMEKTLKAINKKQEINKETAPFYKIMALAHLRNAEQVNCIQNHSAQSCIVPIKGAGIHKDPSGAIKALELYKTLLKYDKNDYQSKWFINVAYMALGDYPHHVPTEHLIAENNFTSDSKVKHFRNVAIQAGVAVNNHAGGSITDDFNNDGLIDIFTTSYSLAEESKYLINTGEGIFHDHSEKSGLKGLVGGLNAAQGDLNNDGYTDIIITRGAWLGKRGQIPNSILYNRDGLRFEEVSKAVGMWSTHPTGTVAMADVDLDGFLDVFFGNEGGSGHQSYSELYMNDGNGNFMKSSLQYGLEINAFVKGASWGDINGDLYPDLYLSIYGARNKLFVNRLDSLTGKRFFEDISQSAQVDQPIYSFPCWFWDYNNDGLEDIIVFGYDNRNSHQIPEYVIRNMEDPDYIKDSPRLFKNNGDETFADVTSQVGLERPIYAMGANFGDLNNDGFLDFYAGTGEFNMWAAIPNLMFLNEGGENFVDVTYEGGFGQIQKGHGVSFGDLDNDGDQDIYHQVGGAAESDVFHNMLFENPGFTNYSISLKLVGQTSNKSAIGAKITLHLEDGSIIHHTINSGGSFGASSLRATIGTGKNDTVQKLVIQWPNSAKTIQEFKDIKTGHHYQLEEGGTLVPGELPKFQLGSSMAISHSGH